MAAWMTKGILLALTIAALAAQDQPPPTFRAITDVVEVDVSVRDKTGAFVTDLSVDDFLVEDNGRPQRVEQLYVHLADRSRSTGGPTSSSTAAVLPAMAARRVFVAVFDNDHLSSGGFRRVQQAAVTLFESQFADAIDLGGVLTDGRIVNNRLTSSREELVKAVKDAKSSPAKNARIIEERQWPRMTEVEAVRIKLNNDEELRRQIVRRALEDDPNARPELVDAAVDVKAADLSATIQNRTNRTLQVAATLMNGLEKIPGRKSVLLLTEGFLANESWPLVKNVVALAARADARVYTLDARGLDRGLRSGLDVNPGSQDSGQRLLDQMDFGGDVMNSLAVDTGGFVVRNVNDFARAIGRIADDANNFYVLGYRPTLAPDGSFHALRVRVKRSDVAVRARRGYVASPRPRPQDTNSFAPLPGALERASVAPAPAAHSPADADLTEPASSTSTNTAGAAVHGLRVRPGAARHVDLLLQGVPADAAARAGWNAYERGDVVAARASLATAAASNGARPWVHYALGLSEYALKEFRESATEWETVRRAAPEFEPVYFDLVDSYLQLKDHERALRALRAAQDRWPRDPDVFNALGVVQTSRGSLEDAVKSFQRAVEVAPNEAVSYFNLGHALELRYARSKRYVQQLRSWVSNDRDRADAIGNYKKYLTLGGPLEQSAQEGLTRLQWSPQN